MSLTRLLASLPEPLFSTYKIERVLGVGAYAVVYQIRSIQTKEAFALKVVEKEPMRMRQMMQQLDREVVLLEASFGSPHIVQLLEVLQTSTHLFMRFVLCEECLEDACEASGAMNEEEAFDYFRQICLGVQALHIDDVIHRDLKPSNFLIDRHGVLCLCDFGWACRESDRLTGSCGTPQYSAPECKGGRQIHTKKADIYGLGCCLQHMLLGRVPLGPNDFPKGLSEETVELLQELMHPDPDARPTIEDVLLRPQLSSSANPIADHLSSVWRTLSDFLDMPEPRKPGVKVKRSLADTNCGF